jgi:poly-gamma-glutamate synthesis protein (capsule biosynthesis protein)
MSRLTGLVLLPLIFLSGCAGAPPAANTAQPAGGATPMVSLSPTGTPFQPAPVPSAPADPSLPAGEPLPIWIDPALPASLPPNLRRVDLPGEAAVAVTPRPPDSGYAQAISQWIYLLAAPFPTIADSVSAADLQDAWNGNGTRLLMDANTFGVLIQFWGSGGAGAEIIPAEGITDALWARGDAWAIIPFEAVNPRLKVLAVDGQSPLRKDFSADGYPLAIPFWLDGDEGLVQSLAALYGAGNPLVPPTNRDPSKLTTVVLTGVTALVRATAWTMEQQGIAYPARDIGAWLRDADILHISNEVPFAEDCPSPNPVQANVVFCSDPRYIGLLEEIGTDVVELTGDHFADWGVAAMLYTLDLYAGRNWLVYGGGANFEAGRAAVTLAHNGNRIAFIGCNGKGGGFAQANATNPGAARCDFDWMHTEIARLAAEGVLVIATFQHFEYYTFDIPDVTKADFRGMAQAGAVIVSGSQAHHPHGFEFVGDALLHFGLGNTFFDQYGLSPGTSDAFIDRHVFYDGRYLGTELLTIVFEDYARARPMTDAERRALLEAAFDAGGW